MTDKQQRILRALSVDNNSEKEDTKQLDRNKEKYFRYEKDIPQVAHKLSENRNRRPYKRRFAHYSERLSTFENLPKSVKQSHEDLAATGLYYKGSGDKCRCYMCGFILCEWEESDIPEKEHRKINPDCELLR